MAQQIRRLTGYCTSNTGKSPLILNLTHYCTLDGASISVQTCGVFRASRRSLRLFPQPSFCIFTRLSRNQPGRLLLHIQQRSVPLADVSADASQLPQRLFGFAGLIPDGFESRVIRLSPKGQRACQVSPHISVALLTP